MSIGKLILLLTVTLVLLKFAGAGLSWWAALSPVWFPLALVVFSFIAEWALEQWRMLL